MGPGTVYLIGAGPGDPELITVKGRKALAKADVVIYDYLANPALLADLRPEVEQIDVGKRHGSHTHTQNSINQMLVDKAQDGRIVARLKGGDPFIFGRGGEEALTLAAANIPFEVVPGVTAATAVAAYAGIPLTHRGINSSVTFVTGREEPGREDTLIQWESLAQAHGTLVFFMGVKSLPSITQKLLAGGRAADTPVALVRWGTHPCQKTVTGTLDNIVEVARQAHITPPALIVVGGVVALREQINWFEGLPLFGRRVLVTRAVNQAGTLLTALAERGAEAVPVPTLLLTEPSDFAALDAAIHNLAKVDWLVLTSANGVNALFSRLDHHGLDSRALGGVKLAVVGEQTEQALGHHGIQADLIPVDSRAEGLLEALLQQGVAGLRIVLAQADNARKLLAQGLMDGGAQLSVAPCYRSMAPDSGHPALTGLTGRFDYVTFTSGATVNNLHHALGAQRFGEILDGAHVVAIGPVTAAACEKLGLSVTVQPDTPSIPALVDALCDHAMNLKNNEEA